jgi:hypothetical protein
LATKDQFDAIKDALEANALKNNIEIGFDGGYFIYKDDELSVEYSKDGDT